VVSLVTRSAQPHMTHSERVHPGRPLRAGMHGWILVGTAVLVGACSLFQAPAALAAKDPTKRARSCRRAIAKSVTDLARVGLKRIERCHRQRNKGGAPRDCNAIVANVSTAYGRTENLVKGRISFFCGEDPILQNYPRDPEQCPETQAPTCALFTSVLPRTKELLERSTQTVQGLPSFSESAKELEAFRACHASIGKEHTTVVLGVLEQAVKCQRRLDKRSGAALGTIAPECLKPAGAAARKAAQRTEGACADLVGGAVGSCDDLPGCVVASAASTGHELARLVYGGATVCGNGVVDVGEDCDDGNTDPADACTDACYEARCGDGIVHTGVEECDDGDENTAGASCDRECRASVCGDGDLATNEECDDGNSEPGDGCGSDCRIESLLCGSGGVKVTVVLDIPDESPVGGMIMLFRYPPALSVPGSGISRTVFERVENLTGGIGAFLPTDVDTDGDQVDDTVRTVLANSGGLPVGPTERITFQNDPGVGIRPTDFTCSFADVVDPLSNPLDDETVATLSCFVDAMECLGGVVTTTTIGPTTTTFGSSTTTTTTITTPATTSTTEPPPTTPSTTTTSTSTSTTSSTVLLSHLGQDREIGPSSRGDRHEQQQGNAVISRRTPEGGVSRQLASNQEDTGGNRT